MTDRSTGFTFVPSARFVSVPKHHHFVAADAGSHFDLLVVHQADFNRLQSSTVANHKSNTN